MTSVTPIACVNVAIVNAHREVLLTLRSKRVREPGRWCLPGGHIDPGEGWLQAAIRETKEEVGLVIVKPELIGLYSDPKICITDERLAGGGSIQYLCAAFRVFAKGEIMKPNDEVEDWDWFSLDNLPEPMLKSHPQRVRDALEFDGEVFLR
jgi:glycerol 3-phosphatase-2